MSFIRPHDPMILLHVAAADVVGRRGRRKCNLPFRVPSVQAAVRPGGRVYGLRQAGPKASGSSCCSGRPPVSMNLLRCGRVVT